MKRGRPINSYDFPLKEALGKFEYIPDMGKIYHKVVTDESLYEDVARMKQYNSRFAGMEAFTKRQGKGFVHPSQGIMYRADRMAWTLFYGEHPKGDIIHKNGDWFDSRINNLTLIPSDEVPHYTEALSVYEDKDGWYGVVFNCSGKVILPTRNTRDEALKDVLAAQLEAL